MHHQDPIRKFVNDQLSVWPLASANFRDLKSVDTRTIMLGGLEVVLQHNPCRILSSTAQTDPESIAARPCFLCLENEPKEQMHYPFDGRKGRRYFIQVNPYPIFPDHLVICSTTHQPQSIWHHYVDMLDLAMARQDMVVFYNGPHSGASAPDHLHFQAAPRGMMPLENAIDAALNDTVTAAGRDLDFMHNHQDAELYHYKHFCRGVFAIKARTAKSMAKMFYRLIDAAPMKPGETEPEFNLLTWCTGGEFRAAVIFRSKHWSSHYTAAGEKHLTMGLGCADMAGYFIVPVKEDYDKLTPELLGEMVDEVTMDPETEQTMLWKMTRKQPKVLVGIMSAKQIKFEIISDGAGIQTVTWRDGRIDYNGTLYDELMFDAVTRSTIFAEPSFILHDVTIGIGFHWERKMTQKFAGSLRFVVDGDKIVAINRVGVENYLLSVISSEMKPTASLELLKAHAVISRSWVMNRIAAHDAHRLFDVCADDHCQRYQGLTMVMDDKARRAVDETWGQVLTYGDAICDTRFSKCCGGSSELFSSCWEDVDPPYLQSLPDTPGHDPDAEPFCHTDDPEILSQVLNDYDLETKDFYDWTVRYNRDDLSELVSRKSGKYVGTITGLEPLAKGPSGRITSLRIKGTAGSMVVGKELNIRKYLSPTHLKSSAFTATFAGEEIILKGRGWGHGVGLCQIGAAVMGARGYNYKEILGHYYPGSEVERR